MANPLLGLIRLIIPSSSRLGKMPRYSVNPKTRKITKNRLEPQREKVKVIKQNAGGNKVNTKQTVEDLRTIRGTIKKGDKSSLSEVDISVFVYMQKNKTYSNLEINSKSDKQGDFMLALPARYQKVTLVFNHPSFNSSQCAVDIKKVDTTLNVIMNKKEK